MVRRLMVLAVSVSMLFAFAPAASAQSQPAQPQVQRVSQTTAGPWQVIGWRSSQISYCTAERDVGDFKIAFIRVPQGFGLLIHSPTWQLDPNNPVPIQVARRLGQTSLSGRAITTNIVLVPIDDNLLQYIAEQTQIEVTAAGTLITVPLDRIAEAVAALGTCLTQAQNPPGTSTPRFVLPNGPTEPKPTSVKDLKPIPGLLEVPTTWIAPPEVN